MSSPAPPLDPATALGPVQLTVADLTGVAAFYERVVGLRTLTREDDIVRLGAAPGGPPLVELVGRAGAPARPRRSCGLFHLALLVPDRAALARTVRRVTAGDWPLSGASDHLVSEALYLSDPEGNGIEIYHDRPRAQWRHSGGELEMATLPLDLVSLMRELPAGAHVDDGLAAGTRLGHVHLQVSDLADAERFYGAALGLEVTVRSYPGALFLAAGGYHHHVGLNTWASAGGPPAVAGTRGLRRFTLALPTREERARVAQRIAAAGFPVREDGDDPRVTDPFGTELLLTVAHAQDAAL